MKTQSKIIHRLLSLALCACMVLALMPAIPLVADAASTVTVYFQNNWLWGEVYVYYWGSKTNATPNWPGVKMSSFGTHDGYQHYSADIPADATHIIFTNNQGQQSIDIPFNWYDGITYYMLYRNGANDVDTFEICKAFSNLHQEKTVSGYGATCTTNGLTDGRKCTRCGNMTAEQATINALGHKFDANDECLHCDASLINVFFQNNWLWENISLYYWYDGDNRVSVPAWPGTSMEDFGDIENIFGVTNHHYTLKVPDDVTGIIISGYDPNPDKPEDSHNQQTPDIAGSTLYNGIAFYMDWDEVSGNKVGTFDITEDAPCALGCPYDAVVTDPDCLNDGYTTYTCPHCGDTYTADTVPAPGHSEAAVPGYAASCTVPGLTDGVNCSVCGKVLTEQEEIPAPGHKDEDKNGRCDTCAIALHSAYLAKTSASLEGNIAVNYFMTLSDEVLNDETAYMQFTIAGGDPIKVPVSEHRVIDGYYVFTCEVSAKEMTETIITQFFYEGGSTEAHRYDVQTYGKHILENPQYDNVVTKNLITTMLNYGTASQLHFGYNTDNLASTDVTDLPDYSDVDISGFDVIRGQGTDQVKLYSASLILNSETTLRLFFAKEVTAKTLGGEDLNVQYRSGLYYVDIVNIAAKDLDKNVTITINDGTAEANITFNPMAYCQIVQKDTSGAFTPAMKNLACALYQYNLAAKAYFE